jgi:hypothetical protein
VLIVDPPRGITLLINWIACRKTDQMWHCWDELTNVKPKTKGRAYLISSSKLTPHKIISSWKICFCVKCVHNDIVSRQMHKNTSQCTELFAAKDLGVLSEAPKIQAHNCLHWINGVGLVYEPWCANKQIHVMFCLCRWIGLCIFLFTCDIGIHL